ncbi:hypothetical protein BDN70DRAFT_819349, partial [Pholiota conissans]
MYGDWKTGKLNSSSPGYHKIVNFCRSAWTNHGLAFGWMDTVCINKESSAELDEFIRSMYKWYERAAACIIYLAETQYIADIHLDRWFTHGWTFQELLAPNYVKFYNQDWQCFRSSRSQAIVSQITKATTITDRELSRIHLAPLSRRMQLAAAREVTHEEDTAYSLMGIFNVSIAPVYGKGAERSFARLLHEILNTTSE